MIGSAIVAGTSTLYTEDLQDGLMINQPLQIINPFLPNKQ
jgi:predicted nucleic acid-binding protein